MEQDYRVSLCELVKRVPDEEFSTMLARITANRGKLPPTEYGRAARELCQCGHCMAVGAIRRAGECSEAE